MRDARISDAAFPLTRPLPREGRTTSRRNELESLACSALLTVPSPRGRGLGESGSRATLATPVKLRTTRTGEISTLTPSGVTAPSCTSPGNESPLDEYEISFLLFPASFLRANAFGLGWPSQDCSIRSACWRRPVKPHRATEFDLTPKHLPPAREMISLFMMGAQAWIADQSALREYDGEISGDIKYDNAAEASSVFPARSGSRNTVNVEPRFLSCCRICRALSMTSRWSVR
jgi:hypothetical protein